MAGSGPKRRVKASTLRSGDLFASNIRIHLILRLFVKLSPKLVEFSNHFLSLRNLLTWNMVEMSLLHQKLVGDLSTAPQVLPELPGKIFRQKMKMLEMISEMVGIGMCR